MNTTPYETDEQQALFDWAKISGIPDIDLLHAIPNGGHRNKATAGQLKAEGVKRGVPDIFLPVPKKRLSRTLHRAETSEGRQTVRLNKKNGATAFERHRDLHTPSAISNYSGERSSLQASRQTEKCCHQGITLNGTKRVRSCQKGDRNDRAL